MKPILLRFLLVVLVLMQFSCTHKSDIKLPLVDTIKKPADGTYLCMGYCYPGNAPQCDDAFEEVQIRRISDSVLIINGIPVSYKGLFNPPMYAHFSNVYDIYSYELNYDPDKKHFSYNYGWGNKYSTYYASLSDKYKPNPFLHSYVDSIKGSWTLTGTRSDQVYPNVDTTYDVALDVTFTVRNDSTIVFSGQLLGLEDSVLHYKYTDSINLQAVWQTFHTYAIASTLRYNYSSNIITFEQLSDQTLNIKRVTLTSH